MSGRGQDAGAPAAAAAAAAAAAGDSFHLQLLLLPPIRISAETASSSCSSDMWRPAPNQKPGKGSRSYFKDGQHGGEEPDDSVVESLEQLTVEHEWNLLLLSGSLPIPRHKHAAVVMGRRMFVVGGTSGQDIMNDVQVLHMEKLTWTQLGTWSTSSNLNPSRDEKPDSQGPHCTGHSVAFWEKQLVVVGGKTDPASKKISAFCLDLGSLTWSTLNPKGETPVARTGQSVVQVGSMLVMFGGEDSKGRTLNDLHILDLKALAWLPLKTNGTKPSPRRDHSAACYSERYLWIFGGKSRTTYFSDVYYLDFQSMEWTKEKTRGLSPSARAGHSGVIAGDKWYIVGGEYRGNEVLEMLALDMETHDWSVVAIVRPGSPLANNGISVVKARSKGRVYLVAFGGHDAIPSNQVYVMLLPQTKRVMQNVAEVSPEAISHLSASVNNAAQLPTSGNRDSPSAYAVRNSDASIGDLDGSDPVGYSGEAAHPQAGRRSSANIADYQEMNVRGHRDRIPGNQEPSSIPTGEEAAYWINKASYEDQLRMTEQMQMVQIRDGQQLHMRDGQMRHTDRLPNSSEVNNDGRHGMMSTGRDLDPGPHPYGKHDVDANSDLQDRFVTALKINEDLQNRLVQIWSNKVELERALSLTLSEKDELERKFASAMMSIEGLEQQVRNLLKCKADRERRLQENQRSLEEMEQRIASSSQLQEDAETKLRMLMKPKEEVEKALPMQSRLPRSKEDSEKQPGLQVKGPEESSDVSGQECEETNSPQSLRKRLEDTQMQLALTVKNLNRAEGKLMVALREKRDLKEKAATAMHMQEEARAVSKQVRAENLRLEQDLLGVKALLTDVQEELQSKDLEISQAKARNFELQVEMFELNQKFSGS